MILRIVDLILFKFMYASNYSKNLITAEEKVAELMKQRDAREAEYIRGARMVAESASAWQVRAEKAEERLEWLERFLQAGGTSINTVSYYTVENHPDDTDETRFNMPFKIGMSVETENRGCYQWVEFSNGAKGICPAIDAAKIKYDEWRREQF